MTHIYCIPRSSSRLCSSSLFNHCNRPHWSIVKVGLFVTKLRIHGFKPHCIVSWALPNLHVHQHLTTPVHKHLDWINSYKNTCFKLSELKNFTMYSSYPMGIFFAGNLESVPSGRIHATPFTKWYTTSDR